MFANKKVFITAIAMLMALLIGVGIVLLVIFNSSESSSAPSTSTGSSNNNGSNVTNPEEETSTIYEIELNGIRYQTNTTNDLRLKIGQDYSFNLKGVSDFDYEITVEGYLPSDDYTLKLILNETICENFGLWDYVSSSYECLFQGLKVYKSGFDVREYRSYFSFKMEYYDLNSFLYNLFGNDITISGFGNTLIPDLLEIHCFKMNVRKISTDELISFVLYFEE